jgi:hypothetical protein
MVPDRGLGKLRGRSNLTSERGESLEVVSVGKEIEKLELLERETMAAQAERVPRERRRIAGQVTDRAQRALPERADEDR